MDSTDRNVRNVSVVTLAVLAVSAGVVYVNALRNPFIYDDFHTIVTNTSLSSLTNVRAIVLHDVTRPIVNFSYTVDRAVWGGGPFGFHLTGILLHMLNVVLLWQLAWRLSGRSRVATAAAALFAVHPMMTEAVGYISGRSEVLCATFFLAAFLAGQQPALAAMLACWLAALASKETAAMFPFVFAAYAFGARGGQPGRDARTRAAIVGMIAFTILAGLARIWVLARIEYAGKVAIHWPYLLLDVNVVARYLMLLVRPAGQTIFHSVALPAGVFDPRAFVPIGVIAALGYAAWRLRRVEWLSSLGIFWFFALLVPSCVLILLDQGEPMTEHRVYLASIGLFLAAGVGIDRAGDWLTRLGEKPMAFGTLAFRLALLAFAAMTVMRNAVWSNPILLYQESVNLAPAHYRPRLLLGESLLDKGRIDEAIDQFKTAIELKPSDPAAYLKLGRCYAELGKFDEARPLLLKARELDPRDPMIPKMLDAMTQIEARMKRPTP